MDFSEIKKNFGQSIMMTTGVSHNIRPWRAKNYITMKASTIMRSIYRCISTLRALSRQCDLCHSTIWQGMINTYTARPGCWSGWISDSYCSIKPLCSGMGEVVPARTSPTLLPPSPRTVLSLSCFKVSQCINCRDWHCKS